ncbi:hypothetical protein [Streptacidiphilus fuscans]|uniref:Uncharacterized protein n=1 Tax=Streptacidiphilus fuscans TaxID=2789292 RepID=A0A931B7I0_9ACTN|nr:hypothetical protein [Streptacidiphilus fuscans]MBF9072640.1 hypothetical protein [Streptacidiphilus fuscans]
MSRSSRSLLSLRPLFAVLAVLGIVLACAAPRPIEAGGRVEPAAAAVSSAAKRTPAPSGASQTQINDLFNDPIGRIAYVFRVSRGLDKPIASKAKKRGGYYRNVAVAFVDLTGLRNLDTRGYEVVDAAALKTSNPALYQELGLADRPQIQTFAIIPESNEASAKTDGVHSEMKIFLQDLTYLSPQDGGASVGRDRIFVLYSDRSPCAKTCASQVPPTTDVIFATPNGKGSSDDLGKLIEAAKTSARAEQAAVNKEVAQQSKLSAQRAKAEPSRKSALKKVKRGYQKAVARAGIFTASPSKKCQVQALGAPTTGTVGLGTAGSGTAMMADYQTQTAPCDEGDPSGSSATSGDATASGLVQALAEPGAQAPGGIDFSSLQLRYLADPGDGSGLQYAFQAPSTMGSTSPSAGLAGAKLSSDAFFVWLELDPSTFWVNLNPTEPDRIVDASMGRTDVGRIMLQADLQLKKDVGAIIHPGTATGDQFWPQLEGNCLPSRVWIVPAPAQVHSDGDKLYIVKAPLDVKMETDYLKTAPGQQADSTCPQQGDAANAHNQALFRSLVLPQLINRVNTSPAYADLRRVYLSRVAAEWYRQLSNQQNTTYKGLIDQSNISSWTTATSWKPIDTFNSYVQSYTKGEYHITRTENRGGSLYEVSYVYGGVDMTNVPIQQVSDDSSMDKDVAASLNTPTAQSDTGAGTGAMWLGSPTPLQVAGGTPPGVGLWATIVGKLDGRNGLFALLAVALGALLFLVRDGSSLRRRKT